jgi:hypothetical protein
MIVKSVQRLGHGRIGAALFTLVGIAGVAAAQAACGLGPREGVISSAETQTRWLETDDGGRLANGVDSNGNRIPDFSLAGYANGDACIPDASVTTTLEPSATDDDGPRITSALTAAGSDGSQVRAVLLAPGIYRIKSPIRLGVSGVVLRGSGNSSDPTSGSILQMQGNAPFTAIQQLGDGPARAAGARCPLDAAAYVPVGSVDVPMGSVAGLAVGATVWVGRPQTAAWFDALRMSDIWPQLAPPTFDDRDLVWERRIVALTDTHVTLDIPITNAIEPEFTSSQGAPGYVVPLDTSRRIRNVGVESLWVDASVIYAGSAGGDAGTASVGGVAVLDVDDAQDSWIRDVTVMSAPAAVEVGVHAVRVTLDRVSSLDSNPLNLPPGPAAFLLNGEAILAKQCVVDGRPTNKIHAFTRGAGGTGPVVVTESQVLAPFSDIGPHQHWSSGTLFDDISMPNAIVDPREYARIPLRVDNDGANYGDHGWNGANNVFYNIDAGAVFAESPPTAYNWLIGVGGTVATPTNHPFPQERSAEMQPALPNVPSLYQAQLAERRGPQPSDCAAR